jgi:hypothetical protein
MESPGIPGRFREFLDRLAGEHPLTGLTPKFGGIVPWQCWLLIDQGQIVSKVVHFLGYRGHKFLIQTRPFKGVLVQLGDPLWQPLDRGGRWAWERRTSMTTPTTTTPTMTTSTRIQGPWWPWEPPRRCKPSQRKTNTAHHEPRALSSTPATFWAVDETCVRRTSTLTG